MVDLIVQTEMVPLLMVVVLSVQLLVVVTSLVIELNQFMYNLKKLKIKCMKNGLKVNISPISKLSQILMPQSKCYEKNTKQHCLKNVVGLSIATRPDCLPDDVVEYLAELNERTYLWVELGLQTVHQETSDLINRAHDMKCYYEGIEKLRKHNINICTHIINGLPGEDYNMMMETAKVAQMDVQGIKSTFYIY